MTDLPSRTIIYRYGIRKACCGVIRIGKWDRVYDLMDVTTEQPGLCCTTGCLAGMSVPWIIKIDIQTNEADSGSQTEKSEVAHFDDKQKRCVAKPVLVSAVADVYSRICITVLSLIEDETAPDGMAYCTQLMPMTTEQLLNRLQASGEGRTLKAAYDHVASLFGMQGGSGYVKV